MKTLTASDRSSLIKLASSLPQGDETRKAILSGLKLANLTKTAHRPILPGVTLQAYRDGMARMMYHIDAGKNHSKFYEILIEPYEQGGFILKRRWGALTDSGAGRVDAKDHENLTEPEAKVMMKLLEKEKMGKGYVNAFATQPVGQYPVGLSRGTSFGWGTQEVTTAIPMLRGLLKDVDAAVKAGEVGDADKLTAALAQGARDLAGLSNSSMARELEKRLKGPLSRLVGHPGFIPEPAKIMAELLAIKNYLTRQLQTSNR